MAARIIDGRAIAAHIKQEIKEECEDLRRRNITPGLGFILVGDDPASHSYVRMKRKACQQVGFHSLIVELEKCISRAELLRHIEQFNRDASIHGFLIQHPLPEHLEAAQIVEAIDPEKDVDCFHPLNVGKLAEGREVFRPCTPAGIVELLLRSGCDPAGKHVVILGRSSIVGRPLALLLSRKSRGGNATVTLCHSKTPNIARFTAEADIVIAALGRPEFVRGEMLKTGAVVIDVGINRVPVGSPGSKKEYRLVGDVHFASAVKVAGAITPVPGGVGPMTIAMLLLNALRAAQRIKS